jgi:heat shock protein HslJ
MRAGFGIVLVALLVLGACGDGGDRGGGPGSAGTGSALIGKTFLSSAVDGRQLVAGTELRLTFSDDGTIGASAGCNQFVGELEIEAEALVVTNLGGTEMGCDPERHAQDEWFTGFLTTQPTWELDDDHLTLTAGGTTIVFTYREVADPDQPLVGTRWVVDTLLEGDAASSVPQGAEAYLEFGDDGKISGDDGCNGFGGTYELDGRQIRITERVQTLRGCTDDKMRVAEAVTAATIR